MRDEGRRPCEAREGLEAHHLRPLAKGGTNTAANGIALCRKHHRIVERVTGSAV